MYMDNLVRISKTMFYSWFVLFILSATLIVVNRVSENHYKEQIDSLTEELSLRNKYIEEVTTAHKSLYLHSVFDDEAAEIINYIDFISFDFFKETELLEYGCFAIDVCAYYGNMYYNMVTKIDTLQNLCNAEYLE